MGQFDRSQRALEVHRLHHQCMLADVIVVPQALLNVRRDIRRMMNVTFFGRNNSPTALGFHTSHCRGALRARIAHSATVRHLVKTIASNNRADLHRFKQDVVSRVARHSRGRLSSKEHGHRETFLTGCLYYPLQSPSRTRSSIAAMIPVLKILTTSSTSSRVRISGGESTFK